jgi:perosamine synthetase
LRGDIGPLWSHHVLQLLCHQDLNTADVDHTAQAVLHLLQTQQANRHAVST